MLLLKTAMLTRIGYKAASVLKSVKSKGPKPVEVYNDERHETALEYGVEKITDSRVVKNKIQYLVKWVGYPESESTWEPEANVRNAQDAITQFDIDFPNKEYPKPVVKKAAAGKKKKSSTPARKPAPEPSPEQAAPVAFMT